MPDAFSPGFRAEAGSSFARFEAGAAWKEHRRRLDTAWAKAETRLIGGLRDFQRQELGGALLANSTVFYPFGGPDSLTATLCFPRSPMYVIVGLEPPGTLPAPEQLAKHDVSRYLACLRETMAAVLGRSFFITREMDRQVSRPSDGRIAGPDSSFVGADTTHRGGLPLTPVR